MKGTKHCGKMEKCQLQVFSPVPSMFSKGYLLRVVKSWDCVAELSIYFVMFLFSVCQFVTLFICKTSTNRGTDEPHVLAIQMILQDVVENIVEIKEDSLIDCNAGCLLPFSTIFQFYRGGHCTYP